MIAIGNALRKSIRSSETSNRRYPCWISYSVFVPTVRLHRSNVTPASLPDVDWNTKYKHHEAVKHGLSPAPVECENRKDEGDDLDHTEPRDGSATRRIRRNESRRQCAKRVRHHGRHRTQTDNQIVECRKTSRP